MKNIFVFIYILFLAFFYDSKIFAQDSTSIKITLPNSEEWNINDVGVYNFLRKGTPSFKETDTLTNSLLFKFVCNRAIEQNIYIRNDNIFQILVLPNDNVEIVIDEEGKPIFLKGKAHRENQILYDNDWIWNFFVTSINIHSTRENGFFKIDSIRNTILNEYQIATQNFVVNSTFDTYLRNELAALQTQMFDTDNNNKKINNKYLFTKEYYKYRPIIKDSLESYYPYGSYYVSFLYDKVKNEGCKEDKYERLDNKHYYCAYQKIKTIKDSYLRKHLLMNIFAELAYSVDWWKDEQEEKNYEEVLEEMKKKYPNNEWIKNIEEKVTGTKHFARGAPAPDFTLKDLIGKEVSLSDFKGKYVFVTFWDSSSKTFEYNTFYGNQLLEKFTEKEIVFIFIAINQTEKEWKDVLYSEKSIGVHLFANTKQFEDLKEKYTISETNFKLSDAVFIDKYGRRIFNAIYLPHNMWEVSNIISKGE